MNASNQISVTDRNTELPFFPSATWEVTEADKDDASLPAFTWVQAFFDAATITVPPQLVIWSGEKDTSTNAYIGNLVRFAYSGERINIKGKAILSTANDMRGVSHTSTVIGSTAASDLAQVIVYGGMS